MPGACQASSGGLNPTVFTLFADWLGDALPGEQDFGILSAAQAQGGAEVDGIFARLQDGAGRRGRWLDFAFRNPLRRNRAYDIGPAKCD